MLVFLQIQGAGAQNNMGLDMLMNMFSGLGASGLNAPNTPNRMFFLLLSIIFLNCLAYWSAYAARLKLFPCCVFVVPPEELYATQLSQLQEMGFFDTQENIRALRATSGNVHAAVERLLGNLGQ